MEENQGTETWESPAITSKATTIGPRDSHADTENGDALDEVKANAENGDSQTDVSANAENGDSLCDGTATAGNGDSIGDGSANVENANCLADVSASANTENTDSIDHGTATAGNGDSVDDGSASRENVDCLDSVSADADNGVCCNGGDGDADLSNSGHEEIKDSADANDMESCEEEKTNATKPDGTSETCIVTGGNKEPAETKDRGDMDTCDTEPEIDNTGDDHALVTDESQPTKAEIPDVSCAKADTSPAELEDNNKTDVVRNPPEEQRDNKEPDVHSQVKAHSSTDDTAENKDGGVESEGDVATVTHPKTNTIEEIDSTEANESHEVKDSMASEGAKQDTTDEKDCQAKVETNVEECGQDQKLATKGVEEDSVVSAVTGEKSVSPTPPAPMDAAGSATEAKMEASFRCKQVEETATSEKRSEGSAVETVEKPKASHSQGAETDKKILPGGFKPPESQTVADKPNLAASGCGSSSSNSSSTSSTGSVLAKPPRPRCPKCNRSVRDKAALESHVCEKEGEEEVKVKVTISANKEKETFTCNDCNFTGGERPFSEHLMCHLMLRPYQCLHCKECFINRKETSMHVHKAHNGAKLSCALSTPKALKKAKALIKEATNCGIISFMARVGAKVPLERDPERTPMKATPAKDTAAEKKKEPELASGKSTSSSGASTERGGVKNEVKKKDDCEKSEKSVEMTSPVKADADGAPTGFSKLRAALTSSAATFSEKTDTGDGPKIVDSYSLKNTESNEIEKQSAEAGPGEAEPMEEGEAAPNLVDNGNKQSEILSFLGPEQPIYRAPLIAPPPLIPAPSSSEDANFPPPPQLSSVASGTPPPRPATASQPAKKNPNFFVCGFNCLFSSLSADEFQEHTNNFHSSEAFYPCYYCGHSSTNEMDLVDHVTSHAVAHDKTAPLFVCGNDGGCQFGTNMVGDYINHMRMTHPQVLEPMCYACGDCFDDLPSLQRHVEQNVIHIVNCPHCPSKATERRAILSHISSAHPGKPKMVSVAKQLICSDRKLNNYAAMQSFREMQPPTLTPAPSLTSGGSVAGSGPRSSSSVVDQILSRHDQSGRASTLSDILTGRATVSPGRGSMALTSTDSAGPSRPSPVSTPDLSTVVVKNEVEDVEEEEEDCFGLSRRPLASPEESSNYTIDENGVRRRIYVPMSERQAENFKCRHCTFIARDLKRLHCHERSHGMPPTRKDRFKCMFCPQGFDSEMKFRLHITCHPGTIRFLLYRCNKCEFDTNKKDTIVKHITCNRDRKHRGTGPVEAQYSTVSRHLVSRVLICERCDYMTRHKIHMAIHYQRAHSILRDKGDFVIEGLTPTDTPVSSFEEERDDEELRLTLADPSIAAAAAANAISSPNLQAALKSSPSRVSSVTPNGAVAAPAGVASAFDFARPTGSAKRSRDRDRNPDQPVLSMEQVNERNDVFNKMVSQLEALTPGRVLENQVRKFKCPICEYLLPKAADLKNHVKRHSEVGQITLTMFRCKYCSCMSTARTLLYEHLGEKHPGKPISLVKKIVAIDTAEVDKSFAETSVEENLDQLQEALHKDIMDQINKRVETDASETGDKPPRSSFEQLFVIPEGGERFDVPLQCPRCPFSSHEKVEIIGHVNGLHPEVKVIGSDEDVDRLARETKEELQQQREAAGGTKGNSSQGVAPGGSSGSGGDTASSGTAPSQEDVLIVPDEPVFKEEALCSRCNFTTFTRKEMVTHLQRHHPDISVMGRNSYPMQVAALDRKPGSESQTRPQHGGMDSCIVGSGSLDAKIGCLYQNYGTQMRCLICGTERPKKFFIHVHILRHLNIYLWKCAFCPHRGLQKYKMVDHIKKIHPGKAMSVRYLRVNVEAKVKQFLQQFDINTGPTLASLDEGGDGGDAGSRSSSPWQQEASETSSVQEEDQGHQTPGSGQTGQSAPLYTLGSESLDEKLSCLYDFSDGVFYKCLACPNQFQRRFAIHRHIVMAHLKVNLLKCGHCPKESVERHLLIDHSLACHTQSHISITAIDLDLTQAVSDFLAKVASGEITDNNHNEDQNEINAIMNGLAADNDDSNGSAAEYAENYYNRHFNSSSSNSGKGVAMFSPSRQKLQQSRSGKSSRFDGKGGFRSSGGSSGAGSKKATSQVDPDVIMLGRDALDRELRCLYQPRPNGTLRCLVCRWEFPRKYPLHRHMMLKHLRMMLVGCPYCPFEGVEKYNVSSHIKEEHPDQPINIKYVSPDVRTRVKEFVDDMAMSGGSRCGANLIKKPTSSRDRASAGPGGLVKANLLALKMEKKDEDEEDDEEEKEDNIGEEDDEDKEDDGAKKSPAVAGLVVAMFGKKKAKESEARGDVTVKTEVQNEEYNDGDTGKDIDEFDEEDAGNYESLHNEDIGNEEEGEPNEGGEEEEDGSGGEVTLKRPLMESYAPGAYRPCGGKPKALDVITNIKVLKAREGGSTKFYCELCKFTSLHRSNIVRHIYKIHEKYQTHTCPVCNYQTLSLLLMEGHMEKSHPGVEYSEDSFTLNPPRSKPKFTPSPNYNTVGGARPLLGPKSFQKRRQDMLASLTVSAQSSSKGPKQFACAYCHYETNTQEDILQHTRERHSNGEDSAASSAANSKPPSSPTLFSPKSKPTASACWDGSKKAIKRSLSPGSSHPSPFSEAGFRQPAPPKRKKRFVFEKGDELIHCLDCGSRETSMGRMEDHCAYEHPGRPMSVKRIPAWRFVCKSCVVKTMATSKMKYHLNRHVNYRPYTCSNCGAFFPSPDQCRRHSRSQGHDDQYTYVRVAKKEARVEELLSQARELALKIQDEAVKDQDFDITRTDEFITRFQESKTSLKRSAPLGSAKRLREMAAEMAEDADEAAGADGGRGSGGGQVVKPPPAKKAVKSSGLSGLLDTQHENVTIKCYTCGEFTAPTVHEVREHHRACHSGRKFLWQDVERGFVCDASGEALPEFDAVPSDSTDVGYTTKMSLGAGASPMRFKCKSCDFSSSVIQAMKSHLKSHQPKGFMCAYCSRSFSGKEKLGRHQACLHPNLPLWTIHLRRIGTSASSSSASSSAAAAGTSAATAASATHSSRAKGDVDGESTLGKRQTARRTGPKASAGYCSEDTTFLCPDCDFTSNSLYHFRRHMANQHSEAYTRHVIREPGSEDSPLTCGYCSFPAETEAEFSAHLESHFAARTRQCAHCDYSAYDRNSVLRHIAAKHPGLESKVVEIAGPSTSARSAGEGVVSNAVGVPLVVDMAPFVQVGRLTEDELERFGCELPEAGTLDENGEEAEGQGEKVPEDSEVESHGEEVLEDGGHGEEVLEDGGHGEEDLEEAEVSDLEDHDATEAAVGYEKDDDYVQGDEEEEEEEEEEGEDEEGEEEEEQGDEEESMLEADDGDFINDEEEEEGEEQEADEEEGMEDEDANAEEAGEEEEGEEFHDEESHNSDDKYEDDKSNSGEVEETVETPGKDQSPEELARQLGLVGDDDTAKGKSPPALLAGSSDTVILQFDGLKASTGTPSHNNTGTTEGLKERKDATLLSAQIDDDKDNLNDDNEIDEDDEDDEDEDVDTVTFDTDITLASPLPMISLGDGVALSPVTLDSPSREEPDPEMLLNI